MRYNLTRSDLLSLNDLKIENGQLASDSSLAEETTQKQNEECICCIRNFSLQGNNATLKKLR